MPFFEYTARERTGKSIMAVVEAFSQEELIASLQAKGLYVISVKLTSKEKEVKEVSKKRYHRGVKIFDLIMFADQMAVLLNSGVTVIRSLEILCKQTESSTLLKVIEQIKKDIESGFTFQNALKKHTRIFNDFWVYLVETGEASGHLPMAFEQITEYTKASASLRKKIVSAMAYPLVLICVAIIGIAIFLGKIIPVFAEIFKGFNVELPLLTRMVIYMSDIIRDYFLIIIGTIVGFIFLVRRYISTEMGRWQFDKFKFKLPVIGELMLQISTERFTGALSTLLKSGVPILHALEIAEKMAGNKVMEKELRNVKISVRDGKGVSNAMQNSHLFSPLLVQMIGVGEEIGEVSKMLDRIAAYYKERVETFVSRVSTLIEPIVLIFMGVVIGVLVIAMFLPIFKISSAVSAGAVR